MDFYKLPIKELKEEINFYELDNGLKVYIYVLTFGIVFPNS